MRYAKIIENDTVNTLWGINVSFWLQGCKFRCSECHNPHTWDINGGEELPTDYKQHINWLLHKDKIDRHLSILGGEPLLEQNRQIVYDLIIFIKKYSPYTKIYLWTGYTLKQLKKEKDKRIKEILKNIDILVDGLYNKEYKSTSLYLRGSKNQNVYFKNKLVNLEDKNVYERTIKRLIKRTY